MDCFHSRLRFSPDGRRLLSAGWVWAPVDVLAVYDVRRALAEPEHLDGYGVLSVASAEVEVQSACFLDADRLAVVTAPGDEDEATEEDLEASLGLPANTLGVYDFAEGRVTHRSRVAEPLGTIVPFGPHLLSVYGHPKVVDPSSAEVLFRWPDVRGDQQGSSVLRALPNDRPRLAVDGAHARFAVLSDEGEGVHVHTFSS